MGYVYINDYFDQARNHYRRQGIITDCVNNIFRFIQSRVLNFPGKSPAKRSNYAKKYESMLLKV